MPNWHYVVTVTADTESEADQVMAERLDHDEDYGFVYQLNYRKYLEGKAWDSNAG
jgi:hypothetical protein